MDESLAIGFKNQFFRTFYDDDLDLSSIFDKLATKHQCFTHRNKWQKFIDEFDPAIRKNVTFTYRGGKKRKPYFAFACYSKSDEYQYNSWNEKCLFFDLDILTFNPGKIEKYPFPFSIGEHVIKRIYQRSFELVAHQNNNDYIRPVLDELVFLPTVASVWTNIHIELNQGGYDFNIEPVIPTPNGLLLGNIQNTKQHFLEIRTFVNLDQLTQEQKDVRQILINVFSPHLDSTLKLYPLAEFMGLENSFGIIKQIISDLIPHLPALVNLINGKNDKNFLLKSFEQTTYKLINDEDFSDM